MAWSILWPSRAPLRRLLAAEMFRGKKTAILVAPRGLMYLVNCMVRTTRQRERFMMGHSQQSLMVRSRTKVAVHYIVRFRIIMNLYFCWRSYQRDRKSEGTPTIAGPIQHCQS